MTFFNWSLTAESAREWGGGGEWARREGVGTESWVCTRSWWDRGQVGKLRQPPNNKVGFTILIFPSCGCCCKLIRIQLASSMGAHEWWINEPVIVFSQIWVQIWDRLIYFQLLAASGNCFQCIVYNFPSYICSSLTTYRLQNLLVLENNYDHLNKYWVHGHEKLMNKYWWSWWT